MRRFIKNPFDKASRVPDNTGLAPTHGLDNPNQLDRLPSMSKSLERQSMSPVEAKAEMDATLTSKADLLQTEDYLSAPNAIEKPLPSAKSSASTPSDDTTEEVSCCCQGWPAASGSGWEAG